MRIRVPFLFLLTFILLSSRSLAQCLPTSSDIEGPYYVTGAPATDSVIAPVLQSQAQKIWVRGTVYFLGCNVPVPNPVIDVWHTDENGEYSNVEGNPDDYAYRARVQGQPDGTYRYYSVLPGLYPGRPRHTHLKVWVNDTLKLTTQMYFQGDPLNASDPWASNAEPNRVVALDTLSNGDLEAHMDIILIDSPWTSLEEPSVDRQTTFPIFPNPADRSGIIQLPERMTVRIMDLSGRIVMDWQQANQLNVSPVSPGMYILRSLDGRTATLMVPSH